MLKEIFILAGDLAGIVSLINEFKYVEGSL